MLNRESPLSFLFENGNGEKEPVDDESYEPTQSVRRLALRGGGFAIDTPGTEEYHIRGIGSEDLKKYFREFRQYGNQCAIPDCSHVDEPGCRIRQAVTEGGVSDDRYSSYLAILDHL